MDVEAMIAPAVCAVLVLFLFITVGHLTWITRDMRHVPDCHGLWWRGFWLMIALGAVVAGCAGYCAYLWGVS